MKGLNQRQLRFVLAYLASGNQTQAAIEAGYSPKAATVQGAKLVTNPKVAAEITRRQQALAKRADLTLDDVVAELRLIGFARMSHYTRLLPSGERVIDLSSCTEEQLAAVGSITVDYVVEGRGKNARQVRRTKLKLHDKQAALIALGRHLGLRNRGDLNVPQPPPPPVMDFSSFTTDELNTFRRLTWKAAGEPRIAEQIGGSLVIEGESEEIDEGGER